MASELGFLIDLFLNHKLPKVTREAVAQRIQMVEAAMAARANGIITPSSFVKPAELPPQIAAQPWASTRAAMANHDLTPSQVQDAQNVLAAAKIMAEPKTVTVIAQTPAAAAAMASRQQAISESISGKTDRTTGRPRKF